MAFKVKFTLTSVTLLLLNHKPVTFIIEPVQQQPLLAVFWFKTVICFIVKTLPLACVFVLLWSWNLWNPIYFFVIRWRGSCGRGFRFVASTKQGQGKVREGESQGGISRPVRRHTLYLVTGCRWGELLSRTAALRVHKTIRDSLEWCLCWVWILADVPFLFI